MYRVYLFKVGPHLTADVIIESNLGGKVTIVDSPEEGQFIFYSLPYSTKNT